MDIIRVSRKEGDYFQMYKQPFKDKGLSLKARGLLATILSLPSDWDFSIKGLVSILKEQSGAVYTAINELIEAGYCKRDSQRDENNRFSNTVYTFFETPQTDSPDADSPHTDFPHTDFPHTDFPHTGNQAQYNISSNIRNKGIEDNKNKEADLRFPYSSIRFMELWRSLVDQPKWRKKSQTALQMSLDKLGKVDELTACQMMMDTIANDWQGLFEPQPKKQAQQVKSSNPFETARRQMAEIEKKYNAGFYDTPDEQ